VIDVGAIREEHIGNGALVLVEAVSVDGEFIRKGEVRRSSFDLHLQGGSTLCVTHNDAGTTTGGRSLWLSHSRSRNIQNQTDNEP